VLSASCLSASVSGHGTLLKILCIIGANVSGPAFLTLKVLLAMSGYKPSPIRGTKSLKNTSNRLN
jgi:hypothetical protein